jgi:hypothetical protein
VELFEQIRREYEFGIGTIRGVAHQLGVHRRMGSAKGISPSPQPSVRRLSDHAAKSGCRQNKFHSVARPGLRPRVTKGYLT